MSGSPESNNNNNGTEDLDNIVDYEDDDQGDIAETKNDFTGADDDQYSSVNASSFEDLLLVPPLLAAIRDNGFEHPSEVQHRCIPHTRVGTDVLCQAKSGMGKTAVFVLSTLQQIYQNPDQTHVIALVLCHARELAYQISKEFKRFKKHMENAVKVSVFIGGRPTTQDKTELKNEQPNIVIGTPGRIKSLIEEKALNLSHLKFFILDECDKMLESLDMRKDVQAIFRSTPHKKQVMMFTATLSDEIRPICKKFMVNPLEIIVNSGAKLTLYGLLQYYLSIAEEQKNKKLLSILDAIQFNQVVIFVKSVRRAKILNALLNQQKFPTLTIHSGMNTEERLAEYENFKDFKKRILVSTDLLGRGIDIAKVNVVINYDMAESAHTYLHRVGRAGRFGTRGLAISFVSDEHDAEVLNEVQKRFEVSIPKLPDQLDCSAFMSSN